MARRRSDTFVPSSFAWSTWGARSALPAAALVVASFSACTCSKAPPEPTSSATPERDVTANVATTASSSASPPATASSVALRPDGLPNVVPHQGKLVKDDAGHYIPTTPPPPEDLSKLPPKASREPDWDLDHDDPARDYVTRYVQATTRYGDQTPCVAVQASKAKGSRRLVEVRDDPTSTCGGASEAVRDVFLVDVAGDRLTRDDPRASPPLKRWPDGSDPEGPPGKTGSVDDVPKWASPIHDALTALKLSPMRVELLGRGSYPVITLAGWYGTVKLRASPDDLRPAAEKLCAGNAAVAMTLFGGLDRANALRIRCHPSTARWDRF